MDTESGAISFHKTPSGIRYGVLGELGNQRAPLLFLFAARLEDTLSESHFSLNGHLLMPKGVLCVSLDMPCHGADQQPGEPGGLDGWSARLGKGMPIISDFTAGAGAVLNHLVEQGHADPERVAACGISRGGFMALHFAAAEPRVKYVAGIAPVTNLFALHEFNGLENDKYVQSLNIEHQAEKLRDKAVFITIGNADIRVDTDAAIAFARRLAALEKDPEQVVDIELHVMPSLGHHAPASAHKDVADWLSVRLGLD